MKDTGNLENCEWKECNLGDVVDLSQGLAINKQTKHLLKPEGLPLLRITDMFSSSYEQFIDAENAPEQCIAKATDIIYTRTGQVGYVFKNKIGVVHNNCFKVKPRGMLDKDFLYWFLKQPAIQELAKNIASGSVQLDLPHSTFKSMEIKFPVLIQKQTAIASVLSSLDDKIDLLHRQNTTLEKMAETLFRQWFVEEAKEEWEEGTLNDILTVKGGTTPSTGEPTYWNGTIHWTSPRDITNLNGIYLFDTERKITELGLSKIGSGLLPQGTLLMSSRAPVGVLAFSEVPIAINQGYIAILDNKGYSKEFIYLWLKTYIDVVHSFSNGSTFLEISKSAFKTMQLQIPPKEVLKNFQSIIKPLFEKIKSNQTQIHTLTALRDTLLPKLMNGEIRLNRI